MIRMHHSVPFTLRRRLKKYVKDQVAAKPVRPRYGIDLAFAYMVHGYVHAKIKRLSFSARDEYPNEKTRNPQITELLTGMPYLPGTKSSIKNKEVTKA